MRIRTAACAPGPPGSWPTERIPPGRSASSCASESGRVGRPAALLPPRRRLSRSVSANAMRSRIDHEEGPGRTRSLAGWSRPGGCVSTGSLVARVRDHSRAKRPCCSRHPGRRCPCPRLRCRRSAALDYQALAALLTDRCAAAGKAALDGLRPSRQTGQPNLAVDHLAVLALVSAPQGNGEDAAARPRSITHQVSMCVARAPPFGRAAGPRRRRRSGVRCGCWEWRSRALPEFAGSLPGERHKRPALTSKAPWGSALTAVGVKAVRDGRVPCLTPGAVPPRPSCPARPRAGRPPSGSPVPRRSADPGRTPCRRAVVGREARGCVRSGCR